MKFNDYNKLKKFEPLKGHLFKRYNSKVEYIFVGHTTTDMNNWIFDNKSYFPDNETDNFTIVVKLEGGQFMSIRSIVEEDNIQEFLEDVKELEYLDGNQFGFDGLTGEKN